MIEILDNYYRPIGTKDLSSVNTHCPEETCRAYGGFWCAGGRVYYCEKCDAYRFFDERFGTYFLMEKGDLAEVYINRHGMWQTGHFTGEILELHAGYMVLDKPNRQMRIGFFEVVGISYPNVGENRFYPSRTDIY